MAVWSEWWPSARTFGFWQRLSEGAGLKNPVTEPKRRQNPKRPLNSLITPKWLQYFFKRSRPSTDSGRCRPGVPALTLTPSVALAKEAQPFNALAASKPGQDGSTTLSQNLTNFIKNPSTGKPSEPIVNNDSLATWAISADGMTAQFPPKVCCVNYYPSTGCKKIYPNIGQYTVFDTPGGTPLFYPLSLTISGQKPLCRNAFLNSTLKINPSKLPQFTPKNTRFFAMRCSVEPVARLLLATAITVKHRQAPSSPVNRFQGKKNSLIFPTTSILDSGLPTVDCGL